MVIRYAMVGADWWDAHFLSLDHDLRLLRPICAAGQAFLHSGKVCGFFVPDVVYARDCKTQS
jgi:hypothetical protein